MTLTRLPAALLLAVMLCASIVQGCSVIDRITAEDTTAKLVVQYAALKFIESGDDPVDRATDVRDTINEALDMTDLSDMVDVRELSGRFRDRVPWDRMQTSDILLANALIDAVSRELIDRFGEVDDPGQRVVNLQIVLGWVLDTTELIAPS
jgi:hypothetical protein